MKYSIIIIAIFIALSLSNPLYSDLTPPGDRIDVKATITNAEEFPAWTFFVRDSGPWGTQYYLINKKTVLGVFYKMHSLDVLAVKKEYFNTENGIKLSKILRGHPSYEEKIRNGNDRDGKLGYFKMTWKKPQFLTSKSTIDFWDKYESNNITKETKIERKYKIAEFKGNEIIIYLSEEKIFFNDGESESVKKFGPPNDDSITKRDLL